MAAICRHRSPQRKLMMGETVLLVGHLFVAVGYILIVIANLI